MSLGEGLPSNNTLFLMHLNGNSTDSSGHGNGTDTDISYSLTNGKLNEGASFNGSSSRIIMPNQASFATNTWTFSFIMVNKGTLTTSGAYILARNKDADLYATLGVGFQSGGNMFVCCNIGINEWKRLDIYTYSAINNGDMFHIVSNYPNIKLYVNSKLVYNGNFSTSTSWDFTKVDSSAQVAIGRAGAYNRYYWSGKLDEVIFENKVWTAQEVQKYYTNALGRFAII